MFCLLAFCSLENIKFTVLAFGLVFSALCNANYIRHGMFGWFCVNVKWDL